MIRLGLIGCGYWGPNLVRNLNDIESAQLVRVSDLRPGRREFVAKRYPHVQTCADARSVLDDASIDGVLIATPPDTHFALAMEALHKGKHVFVEKPLATTTAEAEQMTQAASALKRILMVGHLFLYAPAVVRLRSLLTSGDLGEVFYISSMRANLGPPKTRVDVLWDLAPHDISLILYLMNAAPTTVSADAAFFTNERFAETAFLHLRFPGNRVAHIHVSWLTPNKMRLTQVVCAKKVAVYDDMRPVHKLQVYDTGVDNRLDAKDSDSMALGYGPGSAFEPALPAGEPLRAECEDFVRAIQTGQEPLSSGRRGVEVVRVLEAASRCIYGHAERAERVLL